MEKECLNNTMGVRAADDRLPKKVMVRFPHGGTQGTVPDLKLMLEEYYQLRELDSRGIPRVEKLKNLRLYQLLEKTYKQVFVESI